nr:flavodoxin family protein [uncultured Pseudodesulfovibrio sp.]
MKVLTLLGSARKEGNTATVLTLVEKELHSLKHTVERITLHDKNIKGCLGCLKCMAYSDKTACVQHDDANEVMKKMVEADVILFTTPIYFWGFSAQIKALIDRSNAFVTRCFKPGHTSLLQGKRIGLLATGADSFENNAEGLFTAFDRFADFLLADNTGALYVGDCLIPADLPNKTPEKAQILAHSLVK